MIAIRLFETLKNASLFSFQCRKKGAKNREIACGIVSPFICKFLAAMSNMAIPVMEFSSEKKLENKLMHGLWTLCEEIAFTAGPKIKSQS